MNKSYVMNKQKVGTGSLGGSVKGTLNRGNPNVHKYCPIYVIMTTHYYDS